MADKQDIKEVKTNCKECGNDFKMVRFWQKFCCSKCRMANWDKNHPRVDRPTFNHWISG